MIGRGFHFDFLDPKCASCGGPHFFILGLLLIHYAPLLSHVQASSMRCKSKDISSKYQHCGTHPDGVSNLDCFGKYTSLGIKNCVWTPGKHALGQTYTLIIQQQRKGYCKAHNNITKLSEMIKVYANYNMTAEVFENIESINCTKAIFKGSPKSLLRCGPPDKVSFSRHSGRLLVNVSWQNADMKVIKNFSVRYKALGSLSWSKSPVQSRNGQKCTVENLHPSLVYTVQIQCATNDRCSQCVWSEAFTVPSELTSQPVVVALEDTGVVERKGSRLLYITWKFSGKEPHDGYSVTIGKVSGEAPREQIHTTQPEITLILSYSAYQVNISAVNSASTSPAARQTIPRRQHTSSVAAGTINVTVHSNTSFTIYWKDNLIKSYVCYSVEWMKKGHKAAYMSFSQNKNNYRTLSPLPEPLEPYERYSISLHTRPNKDTCNMRYINNSESTYGTTHFYYVQGSPVSAPTNISSHNVTLRSVLLRWLSIPEEHIRGFLLGYTIHYTEYQHSGPGTERNITVDPQVNSYELKALKSSTAYEVQISGFTQAGEGVRSTAVFFKTNQQEYFNLSGVITSFAVVATVLIFASPIIKRAKIKLWPSIPDPGNSKAMQKIEEPCEQELLESINTLKVEEWDTNSLQIVEREDVIPSVPLLLHASEDEEGSAQMSSDWSPREPEEATGEVQPDITAGTLPAPHTSPCAFSSGYTTMEVLQQVMPQIAPPSTAITGAAESEPVDTHSTVLRPGWVYVRSFSSSPILDSEETSLSL